MLKKIKNSSPDFDYISLGFLENKYPNRIERLSKCRNTYVHQIRSNPNYLNIDFVLIIDFDLKNNKMDLKILKEWIGKNTWAALFTNQVGSYYDIYALRAKGWNESDCFVDYSRLRVTMRAEAAKSIAIWSKMKNIKKSENPIEVQSAFGGLGIYKKTIFEQYDYTPIHGDYTQSEHVTLNTKIAENHGKLYILPDLINFSWNPQNLSKYKLFRYVDRVTKQLKLIKIRKFLRKRLPC